MIYLLGDRNGDFFIKENGQVIAHFWQLRNTDDWILATYKPKMAMHGPYESLGTAKKEAEVYLKGIVK